MPWAIVPRFIGNTFDHGMIYKFDAAGNIVQERQAKTYDEFVHISKGLLTDSLTVAAQPLDVYTYGSRRWPISFKPKQTIDLEHRYECKCDLYFNVCVETNMVQCTLKRFLMSGLLMW